MKKIQKEKFLFDQISSCLNEIINRYENIYVPNDFKIDLLDIGQKHNSHFCVLRDNFNLTNLIQVPACFKSEKGDLLDIE